MNESRTGKTQGQLFPLARARQAALELRRVLQPGCIEIEIAGSVRRGAEFVHDIDLVAWAVYQDSVQTDLFGDQVTVHSGPDGLVACIRRMMVDLPDQRPEARIINFYHNDIPVEIYLAERDGKNFRALLQMRTGPATLNAHLAMIAQRQHLYYRAGHGIYRMGPDNRWSVRVDDGTEDGIFYALGLECPVPSARDKAVRPLPERSGQ